MTRYRAQQLETPNGSFVVVESLDESVIAAGWGESIGKIAAQAGIHSEGDIEITDGLKSASAVRAYYAGDMSAVAETPVAFSGTELQRAVWTRLRDIEPGATVTYGELTNALGRPPTATRAVASACARNPIGLFVQCHRVVAANGGLSGFAWGLPVKAALLEREMLEAA